jgi:hypothetical protein
MTEAATLQPPAEVSAPRRRPLLSPSQRYLLRLYQYGGRSVSPEAQGFEPGITSRLLSAGHLERWSLDGVAITDAGLSSIHRTREQLRRALIRWSRK